MLAKLERLQRIFGADFELEAGSAVVYTDNTAAPGISRQLLSLLNTGKLEAILIEKRGARLVFTLTFNG